MKKILSLDGGGAKGIMQMVALAMLEEHTGKRCHELFDLVIGTSVGAINASMLSLGTLSARELVGVMDDTLPKVFKRQRFRKFKYSKKPLREAYEAHFPSVFMKDAKTRLIVTAYEDTEGREHFFKSWESKDGALPMFDAVDRSSAAPLFFGQVVDYDKAQVWLDGGVGVFNNPSQYAYVEALRCGWLEEGVECYSLGCGSVSHTRGFYEAANEGRLGGVLNFIDPKDGGIARRGAQETAARFCEAVESGKWQHTRIERILSRKLDGMDKIRCIPEYKEIGESMGRELVDKYFDSIQECFGDY